MGVRQVAALVSIANGIWVFVVGTYWYGITGERCSLSFACGGNLALQVLGTVLVFDSLVCLLGSTKAYYVSAGISAIAAVLTAIAASSIDLGSAGFDATVVVAIVTIALDLVAATRKRYIPEENHPLNLPVFG